MLFCFIINKLVGITDGNKISKKCFVCGYIRAIVNYTEQRNAGYHISPCINTSYNLKSEDEYCYKDNEILQKVQALSKGRFCSQCCTRPVVAQAFQMLDNSILRTRVQAAV